MAIEHPDPIDRFVVKISRTGKESIAFIGTEERAKEKARELNKQYQTDEYKVEPYRGWEF